MFPGLKEVSPEDEDIPAFDLNGFLSFYHNDLIEQKSFQLERYFASEGARTSMDIV